MEFVLLVTNPRYFPGFTNLRLGTVQQVGQQGRPVAIDPGKDKISEIAEKIKEQGGERKIVIDFKAAEIKVLFKQKPPPEFFYITMRNIFKSAGLEIKEIVFEEACRSDWKPSTPPGGLGEQINGINQLPI